MVNYKAYNIFQYIVIFLIILQCESLFVGMGNSFSFMISVSSFICICFLSLFTLLRFRINQNFIYKLMLMFIIFSLFVIIFVAIEYLFIYKYKILPVMLWLISIPIMITFFATIINHKKILKSFFEKYVSITSLLSIISIVFLFLYNIGLPTNTSITSGWTGRVNGYFYLFFVYQRGSIFGIRNSGIFTEPVVFGFILISSLLIQLFILNKKINDNPFKVFITYITIITTNSSSAIIISVLILVCYLLQQNNTVTNLFFIPIVFIGYFIMNAVYNAKKSVDIYSSYSIRMNDIYACFHAWLDGNIFFGNGFYNFSNISRYVYSFRVYNGSFGLSSGFFWMLVSGGIFLLLFYLLPSLLIVFRSKRMFLVAIIVNIYAVYGIVCETYLFAMFFGLFWAVIIFGNDRR